MTAYVALQELPLAKVVRAQPYDPIYGESLLNLRTGQRVSVRDLLYGLILRSGNDAAYDLAHAVSGSESGFVRQMNQRLRRSGSADTHYANPIGLDQRGQLLERLRPGRADPPPAPRSRLRQDRRLARSRARQPAAAAADHDDQRTPAARALGDRGEDRAHLRRRLRAGRLRPAQGGGADLGRPRRAERGSPRRGQPRAARIRLRPVPQPGPGPRRAGARDRPRSATPAASCRCGRRARSPPAPIAASSSTSRSRRRTRSRGRSSAARPSAGSRCSSTGGRPERRRCAPPGDPRGRRLRLAAGSACRVDCRSGVRDTVISSRSAAFAPQSKQMQAVVDRPDREQP